MTSEGVQSNVLDRSYAAMEYPSSENEHVQDPRNFYASESPMFDNSDSDHKFYECAEDFRETLEPEDQDSGQVSGQDISMLDNHAVH